MEFLTLNNGIRMPVIGFGTFMLGGETCTKAVAAAIESGYRMIDTAEAYGNEEQVGNGIKSSGIDRHELFLVTKVNFKSYEHTRETVEQSLRLLQTDYGHSSDSIRTRYLREYNGMCCGISHRLEVFGRAASSSTVPLPAAAYLA